MKENPLLSRKGVRCVMVKKHLYRKEGTLLNTAGMQLYAKVYFRPYTVSFLDLIRRLLYLRPQIEYILDLCRDLFVTSYGVYFGPIYGVYFEGYPGCSNFN